jgi:hypothetical protein
LDEFDGGEMIGRQRGDPRQAGQHAFERQHALSMPSPASRVFVTEHPATAGKRTPLPSRWPSARGGSASGALSGRARSRKVRWTPVMRPVASVTAAIKPGYVATHLRTWLAGQVRALRGSMSQKQFGEVIGKPQTVVSRL